MSVFAAHFLQLAFSWRVSFARGVRVVARRISAYEASRQDNQQPWEEVQSATGERAAIRRCGGAKKELANKHLTDP